MRISINYQPCIQIENEKMRLPILKFILSDCDFGALADSIRSLSGGDQLLYESTRGMVFNYIV